MTLHVENADGIARITLAEPARRNPLSLQTLQELTAAVTGLPTTARVIVIAAEGSVFSAGHDLREVNHRRNEPGFADDLFTACATAMLALQRAPQPTIAEVQGMATAAGCQLVAACDLAVATSTARFATPGVNIGLFCTTPLVPLSRSIGRKRALEMLFTGEPIDAATALEWGLVNKVVEPDELRATVNELATRIAASSAQTLAIGKGAFYAQLALSESDAYDVTVPVMADNARLDVAGEGIDAFLTKRSPRWPDEPGTFS
jgi:enoyl-CoA hydratase/carnithine racemase